MMMGSLLRFFINGDSLFSVYVALMFLLLPHHLASASSSDGNDTLFSSSIATNTSESVVHVDTTGTAPTTTPAASTTTSVTSGLGIPGTTQTKSGYDTELGKDPMCWSSVASASPTGGIPFPNGALVKDFALADRVSLLERCPTGTWLEASAPIEFDFAEDGEPFRPRTRVWYNYTVKGHIDLSNLDGQNFASDEGSRVAIAILACDSLTAGFCSPFVHEQANIRVARELEEKIAAGLIERPTTPTKKIPGNRHGGTHVHSPAIVMSVPKIRDVFGFDLPSTKFEFEVDVPMIVNDPGTFFMVGTLQFFTGTVPYAPYHRYDVSNALTGSSRLVTYEEPPTILDVSDPVLIISYVCIGIASIALLGLTYQTCKYRTHQVLRISQPGFLIAFLLSALVAAVSCFLLDPRSDLWCNLSHPLIIIPLHLFYSITLARLWRLNAVISPLLKNRLQRAGSLATNYGSYPSSNGESSSSSGFFHHLLCCFMKKENKDTTTAPRRRRPAVSPAKCCAVISICCLPQIILQIVAWVLQPQSKTVEYNESQSIGRCICSDGMDHGQSIRSYSLYLLLLLVLIVLIMGHSARNLPSLLNESSEIYDTTIWTVVLTILGGGIILATNSPTTTPDVEYLVKVLLILTVTVNSSYKIMTPKLRMAWSDQKVVVSKLVEDHYSRMSSQMTSTYSTYTTTNNNRKSSVDEDNSQIPAKISSDGGDSKQSLTAGGGKPPLAVRGAEDDKDDLDDSFSTGDTHRDDTTQKTEEEESSPQMLPSRKIVSFQEEEEGNDVDEHVANIRDDEIDNLSSSSRKMIAGLSATSRRVSFAGMEEEVKVKGAAEEGNECGSTKESNKIESSLPSPSTGGGILKEPTANRKKGRRRIMIRQGVEPSKKVVLRMVDLRNELDYVTKQVMCGMNVEPEDWQTVRHMTRQLNDVFHYVDFDFEQPKEENGDV